MADTDQEITYVHPTFTSEGWGWRCDCGRGGGRLPRATRREPYATWRRRAIEAAAEHASAEHRGAWGMGPDEVTARSVAPPPDDPRRQPAAR